MRARILVFYGTTNGQARKVARAVAETFRAEGAAVDLVDAASRTDPAPELYTACVVTASVHIGGFQRSVRRWVKAHASALNVAPTAFVAVCLGVLEHNPALSVKAPRQKLGKGKTPVLTAEEAGELLRSIKTDDVLGLRDRALIGVMVFTFARVSAACGMNVADIFHQQRRLWVRLHEKGGKFHEMPCHHTLEGYLAEYLERAKLADAGRIPLFQAIKYRPYGRGEAQLNGERLHRNDAWAMVRRRARAAGITTQVCNHTFRGTGITAYLENGGTLEKARQMAAHASTRTTQLYDRRDDRVTLDEVVKINIRG